MEIRILKIVGKEFLDRACSFTVNKEVHPSLNKLYKSEHSPIRTQIFWIELIDIYTFVSVHLVRHKHGVEHFVKSNRDDRPGSEDRGRYTPVNHGMFINAQALINMARKRLCHKAHVETRNVMIEIMEKMKFVDPDLAEYMVADCAYRGRCCEIKCCGKVATV